MTKTHVNVEIDLLTTIHGKGFVELAKHFGKMKETAASFIADHDTPSDAREADFISAMIGALDGPEQRAIEAELANPFDYVAEARLTLSPSWHGKKVARFAFVERLNSAIRAAKAMDEVKKTLFYGKDNGLGPVTDTGVSVERLPFAFGDVSAERATNIIHAIIGVFTEAGEMLEALRDSLNFGEPIDKVNLKEETGDLFWYLAILAHECNFTFDEAQRVNIAKLRARFPDKFTEHDANNRNLGVEREILETPNHAYDARMKQAHDNQIACDGYSVGNIGDSDGDDGS